MKPAREGGPVRYRARVEYDGTEFAGFQAQPGRRTVQGELERVLAHLSGESSFRIKAAGRTDAGVHATGQVIAFTWYGSLTAKELGPAIGALLPPDVAIGPLTRVALDFDPRRAEAVCAAIWAFASATDSFEEAVVRAIGLGGDTDTIAAMAGALAGALHGYSAIKTEWIEALEDD